MSMGVYPDDMVKISNTVATVWENLDSPATLELLVFIPTGWGSGASSDFNYFLLKYSWSYASYQMSLEIVDGSPTLRWRVNTGATHTGGFGFDRAYDYTLPSPSSVWQNKWTHMALVMDTRSVANGGNQRLQYFLNGKLKSTVSLSADNHVHVYGENTMPLQVGGCDLGGGDCVSTGVTIDNFVVYPSALSESDIAAHYALTGLSDWVPS